MASSNEDHQHVALAVQSIITQTDRSGNQIRMQQIQENTDDSPPEKKSFMLRIFSCCIQRPKRTLDKESTSSTQSSSSFFKNERISRVPAKMPELKATQPKSKKCLVLDLDETLVHSSFQPVAQAHYTIPVTIEGVVHNVFVIKRPGVDEFLRMMSEHYEIVIYTASLSKYADPLLDELDVSKVISSRLFRENCVFYDGHYVKDLALLNRNLNHTIIVDNSPMSYIFHPENAIDCSTFIDDPSDMELWQIAEFLVAIKGCDDVRQHCRKWREWINNNSTIK